MNRSARKVLIMACLATLAINTSSYAQFGGILKKPGSSQSSSVMSLSQWIDTANEAKSLLDNSSGLLLAAVADKAKLDEINALKKAAAEAKDDKARKELEVKIQAETNAALAAADWDQAASNLAAEQDEKKVKNVGASAYNFVLGVLKDKLLLDTANSVMDAAKSNPMNLKDIGRVREVVSSLSSQMSSLTTISSNLPKLAKVAKVDLPKSESEPAQEISL